MFQVQNGAWDVPYQMVPGTHPTCFLGKWD